MIYLPVINGALEQFRQAYNNHPIRTAGNRTPHQLWTAGVLDIRNQFQTGVRDALHPDDPEGVDLFYGFDPQAPTAGQADTDNIVSIPTTSLELNEAQKEHLSQYVPAPNDLDTNYFIDSYRQTVSILELWGLI